MPPNSPQEPPRTGSPQRTVPGERRQPIISEGQAAINDFLTRKGGSITKFRAPPGEDTEEDTDAEKKENSESVGSLQEKKSELDYAIETLEDSVELSYEDKIKKHDLGEDEAAAIVDSIIEKGFYEKTYPITKKYSVTFRSRTADDLEKLWFNVEDANPRLPATISSTIARVNLSLSMVEFRGKSLREKTPAERMDIIRRMPEALFRIITMKLGRFDRMVEDVVDEGAIQNF